MPPLLVLERELFQLVITINQKSQGCKNITFPLPISSFQHHFLGFPCGSTGKESTCNAGDLGSIPGWGRSPGAGGRERLFSPVSGLENSVDCIFHGVTKSGTCLSDFHFTSYHSLNLHFKATGLEFNNRKILPDHSHNIHSKNTRISQEVFRKEKLSSSRIHFVI